MRGTWTWNERNMDMERTAVEWEEWTRRKHQPKRRKKQSN
jgi:hypothetical protein